jgi:uncharacterized protein YndB with AHSA1/START domain
MSDTRAFEMTLEIAVPADAVWQALTSAEELVRWFPTRADITPGKGGRWLISWDGNWPWNAEIEIWEPNRHLRLIDRNARPYDAEGKEANQSVAPLPISIDWYLEGKGGSTTLRLVHAGFGRGAAWDDEFEGVSLGWKLELNGLKHYLERHRGEDRRVVWNRTVVPVSPQDLWLKMEGPGGVLPHVNQRPGERYSMALSTGDRLDGTVVAIQPNRGVQVTVDGWNDALFRVWIDKVGAESTVNVWLSAYGMNEGTVSAFESRMRAEVDRIAATAVAT